MTVARVEARIAIGRLLACFLRLQLDGAPERDPRVRLRGPGGRTSIHGGH